MRYPKFSLTSFRSSLICLSVASTLFSCKTPAPQDSSVKEGRPPTHDPFVEVDPDLGEHEWPGETDANNEIINETKKTVQQKYDAGGRPARRDAHPKHHGCVLADFTVNESLPEGYARGVFQPGKSYKAWIRYSNGSSDAAKPDAAGEARGMAIKLTGVPGQKSLADEANEQTQDFIMINHPVFFASDPAQYLKVVAAAGDGKKLKALFDAGFRGAKVIFDLQGIKIASPLEAQYFSMVPYKFGVGPEAEAIKFSAKPCVAGTSAIPKNPGPNFLGDVMAAKLRNSTACFEFMIQKRGNAVTMPVEDPTVTWSEKESPFVMVATINISKQIFNSPAQQKFCENLSFTPWHALPEHKPLGGVNRTRKVVYKAVSKHRHQLNGPVSVEPTGNERF